MKRSLLGLFLSVMVMLAGVGEVGAAPASPVASPAAGVEGLLATAAATMSGVSTFRFELTYEEGDTTLYDRIKMEHAEGVVQRPDRIKAKIEAKYGFVSVDVEVVSIDQRIWVNVAGVGDELTIGDDIARVLLDPTAILVQALTEIQEPTAERREQLDGVMMTRIAGEVDPGALIASEGAPVVPSGMTMPVEIAVADNGRVLSLRLSGPLIGADSDDVVRRLDLSAFDEPVEIEEPGA